MTSERLRTLGLQPVVGDLVMTKRKSKGKFEQDYLYRKGY